MHQHHQALVGDRLAAEAAVRDLVAVEHHPQRVLLLVEPLLVCELQAGGQEPADVLAPRPANLLPGEEASPSQDGVGAPKLDQTLDPRHHVLVDLVPVQPRDLVVLAVAVVVAALGVTDLVATQDHGAALRQEHGGKQVAPLPPSQRNDAGIAALALDTAVPGTVVVTAIQVVLAVGLVVLLLVGVAARQ